ncbi:hypothetical protein K8R04_02565 [Candidatus Uhrbacteria bacterium]|nr:hypothetical protein [Candidatus Uhrbacteria bacterium]
MEAPIPGSNGSNGSHALDVETPPGTPAKRTRAKKEEAPAAAVGPRAEQITYLILCSQKSPLLMDQFEQGEMVAALVHGQRNPADKESLLEARCPKKIYRDKDGNPALRADHLLACLRAAGRSIKIGKEGKISTASETKLFAFLELELENEDLTIPLVFPEGLDARSQKPSEGAESKDNLDASSPWKVDVRRGVGEATGIANALVRPRFDKWGFSVRITVDYTAIEGLTETHVKQLFERAGNRVGLLSYRPACNGPFGRFRVDSFVDVKTLENA